MYGKTVSNFHPIEHPAFSIVFGRQRHPFPCETPLKYDNEFFPLMQTRLLSTLLASTWQDVVSFIQQRRILLRNFGLNMFKIGIFCNLTFYG